MDFKILLVINDQYFFWPRQISPSSFGDGDFHESDIHFTSTAPFVLGVALSLNPKNTPSV
jgi:hypothetical protein